LDYKRVVGAAVNAALDENRAEPEAEHRKHGSAVRTVVAGAALAAVARVAVKKAPSLVHMPRLGELSDRVRDRLEDSGWLGDDEDDDSDVEAEAEEDYEVDEEEPDDEPEPDDDELDDEEPEDDDEDDFDEDDDDDQRPRRRIDAAARRPRPPKREKTKA
jgi:hypothetical protein